MNRFTEDTERLAEHYTQLVETHGDSPEAVQMTSRESHERRLEILTQVVTGDYGKVLDFGCGTGELYGYITRKNRAVCNYVGYDISAAMTELAQNKFERARFECRDIFTDGIGDMFDYVFISGVFNNLMSDNWGFMKAVLTKLFAYTNKAISFNGLSTYVDYFDEGLFYIDPAKVFTFCKENLSSSVTLRHDYSVKPGVVPFDYTMYVYQSDIAPRKNLVQAD
ncbi:MAG: class I SAM-dependent methyltransferase [Candidatus Electrothrix sp. AUS1_2]|nr:class I SAM-dependent methyltransferase [Candidatus Electrothrix sp. AUS1_2]